MSGMLAAEQQAPSTFTCLHLLESSHEHMLRVGLARCDTGHHPPMLLYCRPGRLM